MTMELQKTRTEAEESIAAQFAGRPASGEPAWLGERRRADFGRIAESGLPNRKVEAWHFTDLRRRLSKAYPPVDRATAQAVEMNVGLDPFKVLPGIRIVFVNGHFRRDLSLHGGRIETGLTIETFHEAVRRNDPMLREKLGTAIGESDPTIASINGAFADDGLVLRISSGTRIEQPIHLMLENKASEPMAIHTRHLVVVEDGAEVTILETHAGEGAYQSTSVVEFIIGEGAKVEHVKLQHESLEATHLALLSARLAARAELSTFTLAPGAALARNQVEVRFDGEGGKLDANGAMLLRGDQHSDATLFIDHAVPECTSSQVYKTVLDGAGRGVFQGQVLVRPHAQKTDGRQSSRALLLSPKAEMDSKPQLEIYADDVQCAHGSTTGELDPDLMFYLRARGIPEKQAKALLIKAFIADAMDQVRNDDVLALLHGMGERWLAEEGV
jgi:Fe-S cluster assembly protein SufD